MTSEMSLREHLDEMRSRTIRVVLSIIIITIFSMTFGIRTVDMDSASFPVSGTDSGVNSNNNNNNGYSSRTPTTTPTPTPLPPPSNLPPYISPYIPHTLFYPYPDTYNNIAVQLTHYMQQELLPPEVKLIQTAPGQAFFAQIYVSLLIGIIGSMPVIIKEIYGFISPAIGKSTKRAGFKIFVPALLLFIAGILLSYFLVIPFTLDFLYKYGQAIDVSTFLTINDFISFVLQFFLGFGLAFELPIIMYAISLTGMLDSRFWRNSFRYAVLVLIIFGAVITPDGSGVTMWFITAPMILLYVVGILAIERRQKIVEKTVQ